MTAKTTHSPVRGNAKSPKPALLLGARVRAFRRAKGWTVDELAKAVGVDKAHVSRIENNLKTPSIATIARMGQALDVSMGHLLGETLDKSDIKVTRGESLGALAEAAEPALHQFVPLLHGDKVGAFEAFIVFPGPDAGQTEAQHGGQEMLYILSGTVDVIFQSHSVRLSGGDCIHFPGYLEHRLCRVGRGKAKALLVLSDGQ
jgi:transcriptional regulator with XRE-family HTH domain